MEGAATHIRRRRKALRILAALLLAFAVCFGAASGAIAAGSPETARPSVNGRLHVEGTQLVDAAGKAVQLRGVSTHGLTWFPDFLNESLFGQLSADWNCSLIRLAMYSEQYCGPEGEESLALMRKGIDLAIRSDLYVLVDWHILKDGDPNENREAAAAFFDRIAAEYADCPNLIFEICNEPNGGTDWGMVKAYSETIIPVIRKHIPDAVILIGTPEFDRNLGDPLLRPLEYDNVMYVLHFYAASHREGLLAELRTAVEAGLPVFISECGICEATGGGDTDFSSAAAWFTYLNERKISYAVWSLSDKAESSAFFRPGFDPSGAVTEDSLTMTGKWVRQLIRGEDPETIPVPAAVIRESTLSRIRAWISASLGDRGSRAVRSWTLFAGIAGAILLAESAVLRIARFAGKKKRRTYDDIVRTDPAAGGRSFAPGRAALLLSAFCTLIYLCWRVVYSVPAGEGIVAVAANLLLLAVEVLGFIESAILFRNLMGLRVRPLPAVPEAAWPEVDVFIATYNEPTELLRRTVNGCVHMKYPDPGKVHIWICDDNRRPEMRKLAEEMGVGYFDRPDNEGAKAGNLNHALGLTAAPYIVTFDADMIPRSDFLLKTIPYFVDVELREKARPEGDRLSLGLLQTPQSFYDPDVFQYALYSETRAPNEQDFFYRTVEPAKTSTNSVIYGGSNTVLSRKALEDVGGFFTGSITEDFATGLLIESRGYVSLALPEPMASGQAPHVFRDHIRQRTRWGRGVIATARKLKLWRRKGLTFAQRISYWDSVVYWYSPLKTLVYMLTPLLYAVLAVPVFRCNWLELAVFLVPMMLLQDLSLRLNSRNAISAKWSGIYETSVMPFLLVPVLKETAGDSLSIFKVTDKNRKTGRRERDLPAMVPFLILAALSAAGILRLILCFTPLQTVSFLLLMYWLVRNLYFLLMALFLVDGRDGGGETVKVADAEPITVKAGGRIYEGITTLMTEHNLRVYLDEGQDLSLGEPVELTLAAEAAAVTAKGVVTGIGESRNRRVRTHTIEILDFCGKEREYWQILYDRVPTLPQSLHRDFGFLRHLWQNAAHRIARSVRR